jgi:glycosyltransferase involved in cell wall biosynthesis
VAALRDAWGLDAASGLVLILPARLTRWKGQTLAIEAAARVLNERPGAFTLILAGDPQGRGAFRAQLQELSARLGVEERVRLVGHVEDMAAAFKAADVALFPSLEPEAFGRSAAEAQAMGVPVIAANHGGLAETVIGGETGLHCPPGHVDAFAAAIGALVDMGAEGRARLGGAAMRRARELYSLSALQTATLRVYDRVLGDRK